MKCGYIVALRNEKCSSPYELNQGEYKIGSGVDNDIRIRDTHPGLSKIHAVLNVNDKGIVTIVNKSSVAPVKVNDQECPKAKVLSHLDIFHIIDKKFQYFNEEQIQRIDQEQQLEAVKKVTVSSRRTITAIEKSRTISARISTQRMFKKNPSTPTNKAKFLSPETFRSTTKSPKMNISVKSGLELEETTNSSSSKLINKTSDDLETSKLSILSEASSKEDSPLKLSCSNEYLLINEEVDEEMPKSDSVRSENNVHSESSTNKSEEFSFSLPNLCSDDDDNDGNATEIASIKSENISASECNNSNSDRSASSGSVIKENIYSEEGKLTEENDVAAETLNNVKDNCTELEEKLTDSIFKQSTELFDPRDCIFSEANQIFDETPLLTDNEEFVENYNLDGSKVELNNVKSADLLLEKEAEGETNSINLTVAAISEGKMKTNNLENPSLELINTSAAEIPEMELIETNKNSENTPLDTTNLNEDSTTAISGSFQELEAEIRANNVEDSSLTDTSLNESTTAAISGSCQSFSSFTNNTDNLQETGANKNVSELIDVVNFTITPNLNERRTSVETSQLFQSVNCTSTPFHPPNKDKSIIIKDSSIKTRNLEGIRNRRTSLRKNFKFKNDVSFLQRNLVHKRSKSVGYKRETRTKSSMIRRNSLATSSLHTSEATTLIHKIAHGSAVAENTPEKLIDLEDETPKSHIKSRRASKVNKSIANSIAEESTLRLLTPDKLEITSDRVFKTPVNTPGLVIGKNNGNKSLKAARRMSSSIGKNKLMENIIESPINNEKMDKSLEDSPINSLRDLRSTRKSVDSNQRKINELSTEKPNNNVKLVESAVEESVNNTGTFNLSGIDILSHDDGETSSCDLFSRISGKEPLKFYNNKKSKSLSSEKDLFKKLRSSSRKTEGELPSVTSPRVDEWVKEQTTFVQNTFNKLSAAKKKILNNNKDKKKSLIRFSTRRVSKLTNRSENIRKSLMSKGKKFDLSSTIMEKTPTKRVLRPRKRKSESKETIVPKKVKKTKANKGIIEEIVEENDTNSKTKVTNGKKGKKQQIVHVAAVKNLRNGQNKENVTPPQQVQIVDKLESVKSGQKNSARRSTISKLKTSDVNADEENTPKLRATPNRRKIVPLKNQIKKSTPIIADDDVVESAGSSKSKKAANTRKRKLQDEKLSDNEEKVMINNNIKDKTKKRGRKLAKTEEQEEATLSEDDNVNKSKKRGRKEAKTVVKDDEEEKAAELLSEDDDEVEIVVETKKKGRKAQTVAVKNTKKKTDKISPLPIKLKVESTSLAPKTKRIYRKKVISVKSPAPEVNVEYLPEKPKRKYNKKKVQEEKLIESNSETSPSVKVTRSTKRNGVKEIEENSSPTKASKSQTLLTKATKSQCKVAKLSVSPTKAAKLSVSPKKRAKSSVSPRKATKLSVSPTKAAKLSVSTEKLAKRSASPRKAAKLSVSLNKAAKSPASPTKTAKLSVSPTKAAKSQKTVKKTDLKVKNAMNKKSPVAQETKRKNAKKVHEDVEDTPTKMTLRKRGRNQQEEEEIDEDDSKTIIISDDVNSKKVRFMSPFPKKLTPKLTPKRTTRRAKK